MTEVLLVAPAAVPGGSQRALAGLANRLPAFGYHPRAVLLESGPLEVWLTEAGCPVEVIEMGRTRHLHRTAAVLMELSRRCRSAPLVVANESKGHALAGLGALGSRTPCVWWQHGIPHRSLIEMAAATVPAAAVVCSSATAARAQRRLTPRRRVELIHPGVDVAGLRARRGSGAAIRTRNGWDGPVVGVVARLQPWKGQELFLRAAARVAATRPDVHFAVVGGALAGGESDYPAHLRKLVAELEIEDRVVFAGHQEDVYPWFDAFDVAVTASVGEPFGLVTLEAMALGTAVVGVRSSGTTEIVEDGSSGSLVPAGRPRGHGGCRPGRGPGRVIGREPSGRWRDPGRAVPDEAMASKFADLLANLRGAA